MLEYPRWKYILVLVVLVLALILALPNRIWRCSGTADRPQGSRSDARRVAAADRAVPER